MFDKHIISLILNSSIFAKIILGTLLLLSLIAWSIFLQKLAQMGAVIRSLRNNADKKSSNNTAEASNQTMVFPQNKVTIPLIQQGETALKSAVSALRKSVPRHHSVALSSPSASSSPVGGPESGSMSSLIS